MNVKAAQTWLRGQLELIYDKTESSRIAEIAMEHITGMPRTDRLMNPEVALNDQQLQSLQQLHLRLMEHEPVQYVLEEAWFYGLKLFVNKGVLIPRPETEELVHWVLTDINAVDKRPEIKILDVGTGSGCIALALKKQLPHAELWACDASDDALAVARRNSSELDLRVDFVNADFLASGQHQLPAVDIIVSNPPYIPLGEAATMHPNVTRHEPYKALFVADDDPLIFYKALAAFGTGKLHPNGAIYAEIHEEVGEPVLQLFSNQGYDVTLKKDMQGKDRLIRAKR